MKLNAGQQCALDRLLEARHSHYLLLGAAGTGKTSLLKRFIEAVGQDNIVLCATTGRAALRLATVTGVDAATFHATFFGRPQEANNQLVFTNASWKHKTKGWLLIEEASMLSTELWEKVKDCIPPTVRVVFVGDPQQLPPVDGVSLLCDESIINYNFTPLRLTQIMRQAGDSTIIPLSDDIFASRTDIANVGTLYLPDVETRTFNLPDVVAWKRSDPQNRVLITWQHAMRHVLNNAIHASYQPTPGENVGLLPGTELLVQRNSCLGDDYLPNGSILRVADGPKSRETLYYRQNGAETLLFSVEGSTTPMRILADWRKHRLDAESKKTAWAAVNKIRYNMSRNNNAPPQELRDKFAAITDIDYGYCLTIHKSQGSEWPEVGLVVSRRAYDQDDLFTRQLYYTAVTRARQKLVIWYA